MIHLVHMVPLGELKSHGYEIPQLKDPTATCWGSFKARQQGL